MVYRVWHVAGTRPDGTEVDMSGGHWNYLAHQLRERAEYAGGIWRLMAEIERDLDYGISCDSCYDCAKIRTVRALEAFFDTGATDIETSVRLMASSEPECQACRDRLYQPEKRAVPVPLTEDRTREIVIEIFNQMIEPAAARISESVKQMVESMDEGEMFADGL